MSIKVFFTVVFLVFGSLGCAEKIVSECDEENKANNSQITTYSFIQKEVFDKNCTTSGCHGNNSPQANLVLTPNNSYQNLLNVQSELFPSYKRIVPGNSQASLLIKVLKGDGFPLMPPQGGVSNELIDSVAAWIDRGALLN